MAIVYIIPGLIATACMIAIIIETIKFIINYNKK